MRFRERFVAVFVALSAVGIAGAQTPAKTYKVEVTVVDASGKPSAGTRVATMWAPGAKGMEPETYAAKAVTDKAGKAVLELVEPLANLMAYDAAMKNGALGTVNTVKSKSVQLRLAPLATLKSQIRLEGSDSPFERGMAILMVKGENASTPVLFGKVSSEMALKLPAGKYDFDAFSVETDSASRPIELKAGQTLDLGKVVLPLTGLMKSYGKAAPPINVTEARGLDKPFNLADYKGKWVVLEFWGFW
jgi:hypothetical protein